MTGERLCDYLDHMRIAAEQAATYVEGLSKSDFLADTRTQQAVILNIIVMGEAATKLLAIHADFLMQFPDVPWASMRGMRNRIAHGYFDINMDVVWDTVQEAVPHLLSRLPAVQAAAGIAVIE